MMMDLWVVVWWRVILRGVLMWGWIALTWKSEGWWEMKIWYVSEFGIYENVVSYTKHKEEEDTSSFIMLLIFSSLLPIFYFIKINRKKMDLREGSK